MWRVGSGQRREGEVGDASLRNGFPGWALRDESCIPFNCHLEISSLSVLVLAFFWLAWAVLSEEELSWADVWLMLNDGHTPRAELVRKCHCHDGAGQGVPAGWAVPNCMQPLLRVNCHNHWVLSHLALTAHFRSNNAGPRKLAPVGEGALQSLLILRCFTQ